MEIVEIKNGWVFCDSGMIARKFKMQHAKVSRAMETLIPKLDDFKNHGFNPEFKTEEREYRGSKYKAYLLNRDCFLLLGMRFDTKDARQWQGQFIAAFNAMEHQLIKEAENKKDPDLIERRFQLTAGRKEETDVIKEFVEYAISQGSTKAKWYYAHLTNATYKALGLMVQKKPKLRDTMDKYEMAELSLAEKMVRIKLKKYMDLGRNYKDIYESVKDDLIAFGSGLKIE